jgi:hypothetical protein
VAFLGTYGGLNAKILEKNAGLHAKFLEISRICVGFWGLPSIHGDISWVYSGDMSGI